VSSLLWIICQADWAQKGTWVLPGSGEGVRGLRHRRSGIARRREAKRLRFAQCGLQRSQRRSLLRASGKSCSQRGTLGLLPGCPQVALSLRAVRSLQEHLAWWQWQSCREVGALKEREAKCQPGVMSRFSAAPRRTVPLFQPSAPLQLQGSRGREA